MKAAWYVTLAVLLAGCGSAPVAEPTAAAGASGSDTCVLAQKPYRHGATSCQTGTRFRCETGVWNSTFTSC